MLVEPHLLCHVRQQSWFKFYSLVCLLFAPFIEIIGNNFLPTPTIQLLLCATIAFGQYVCMFPVPKRYIALVIQKCAWKVLPFACFHCPWVLVSLDELGFGQFSIKEDKDSFKWDLRLSLHLLYIDLFSPMHYIHELYQSTMENSLLPFPFHFTVWLNPEGNYSGRNERKKDSVNVALLLFAAYFCCCNCKLLAVPEPIISDPPTRQKKYEHSYKVFLS